MKKGGSGDKLSSKAFLDHLVNWYYVAEKYEVAIKWPRSSRCGQAGAS
jgi:hypothetical protein